MGGALKRATRAPRVVLPTHCALNGVVERPLARYRTSASDSSLWLQWVGYGRPVSVDDRRVYDIYRPFTGGWQLSGIAAVGNAKLDGNKGRHLPLRLFNTVRSRFR